MAIEKISRRQFLGSAAAVAAASLVPTAMSVAPAVAITGDTGFPGTTSPWVPLDAKAAARRGYEIYRGRHQYQSG